MTDTSYPSKLLVFGEHTVLRGSQALAMPLPNYAGRWQFSNDKTKQYDLPKFADYIKNLVEKNDIGVLNMKGTILCRLNQLNDAVDTFQIALSQNPSNSQTILNATECFLFAKDIEGAKKLIEGLRATEILAGAGSPTSALRSRRSPCPPTLRCCTSVARS